MVFFYFPFLNPEVTEEESEFKSSKFLKTKE